MKLESAFSQSVLKKKGDPDAWITQLEEMRMQLEEMSSTMSDDQFLIHILNNLTGDYELQVALLEKRIGNTSNPLTVDELREELNLKFERMNAKKDDGTDDGDAEQALVSGQFKGKCHNCGKIGHKSVNCHLRKDKPTVESKSVICHYCKKPGHKKSDCFKLKRKLEEKNEEHGLAGNTTFDVNLSHQQLLLTLGLVIVALQVIIATMMQNV